MLDIKFIREKRETVEEALKKRGEKISLDQLLSWDKERRQLINHAEDLKHRRNKTSDEIGVLKKKREDAAELIQKMQEIKEEIKKADEKLRVLDERIKSQLLLLPNLPDESVPLGKDPKENRVIRTWGDKREFDFQPAEHSDIGAGLDILDFDTGAKLSGSRFALLKGDGALLERALINFMLDVQLKRGYREIFPPFMVTGTSMTGTGQLPKFEIELYKSNMDDLYLIPTGEVPLTNLHRDEVLSEDDLPLSYVAYTACFRREAGSYGKDTKGLIRNHQFNKIELVKFTEPFDSPQELENLVKDAEEVLKMLELPHRVILLCTGDLGFASAKTYDLEVWMPGERRWREVSSCSSFLDFQARRMNIKYRKEGRLEYVHTLNGSGLAVGRTMAALLENFQRADGRVDIPPALRPYMNGKKLIE